ncbi:replication/maintenance protein RepL [uncultured Anaerobiospirillum sp.]|uniref:replication/maintenance protein RepL n=1 Tax=uncultured Anaerobiospirillum sp. TaxID=265728 RepID=UPI002804A43E|nr:replication/maintenance protein RepL [uncultured Anaerobiospirillum sp.]
MTGLTMNNDTLSAKSNKGKDSPQFCFAFFDDLLEAIDSHNLQMSDIKVLLKYASDMEYGNEIKVTQDEVARDLNLSKQAVCTAFKNLEDAGFFIKTDDSKLFMNWNLLDKGNSALHRRGLQDSQKANAESLCDKQINEIKTLINDATINLDERTKLLLELINKGNLELEAKLIAYEAYQLLTYKKGDAADFIEEESLEY